MTRLMFAWLIASLLFGAVASAGAGEAAVYGSDEDRAAILATFDSWNRGWKERNAALAVQDYADDVDWTNAFGDRFQGKAALLAGLERGEPYLYQTDPAGIHSRWRAQVIGGRNAKSLREFLEKQYSEDMTEEACVRLAVQALLEVVDSGAKTIEMCVLRTGGIKEMLTEEKIDAVVKEIEAEQEEKRAGASGDE